MGSRTINIIVKSILIVLGVIILLFYVTFRPFKIPSGAMIPTLLVGDHLLVNKYDKKIYRGVVIVFTYPNTEHDPSKNDIYYIKRVVGIPGDSIDLDGRQLVINGKKVPLTYTGSYVDERNGEQFDEYNEDLLGHNHPVIFRKGRESTNKGSFIPVSVVPEGYVFVMGDNRDNSQDSRFWGFVPNDNIAGKAFLIHWSWDFDNPDIQNKVRWKRLFSSIE
ncbi:MAG: signal peptidase I [Thermodesulfobacteriota bacterium]